MNKMMNKMMSKNELLDMDNEMVGTDEHTMSRNECLDMGVHIGHEDDEYGLND
jgi:hypothetical protein